jgi:hypothetical protein
VDEVAAAWFDGEAAGVAGEPLGCLTVGGTIVRAASAIALGALPTATRASSASVPGVAYSAAAATWSRLSAPVLRAWSSAGRLRNATLVRVIRSALRWSLLETCASHCALDEHPAARQSPSSSASRTICVTRCLMRASCSQSERSSRRRASRRRSRTWSIVPSSVANICSYNSIADPEKRAENVPICSSFRHVTSGRREA